MTPAPAPVRYAAAAAFVPALAVLTWKLLEPNPVPEPVRELLSVNEWLVFLAAKAVHAGGYAFLTALAWTWAPTRPWKGAAVAFMLLHGAGTEVGQTFVPNRTGTVRDVVIDAWGVAAGALLVRRFAPWEPTRAGH